MQNSSASVAQQTREIIVPRSHHATDIICHLQDYNVRHHKNYHFCFEAATIGQKPLKRLDHDV
jgi:hypothetical protein